MPEAITWGQRIALWIGRRFALRHQRVTLARSCRIHAGAKVNPRSGHIRIGECTTIADGAVVQGNVSLGDHCSVQIYSILVGYGTGDDPDGRILIGNYVRIASHVMMIGANHVFADDKIPIHRQGLCHQPIVVEDDVWIGGGVVVLAGVTLGRGTVIGAGSVVTKNIPPMSVAVGNPARIIKSRVNVAAE
jgi:acetyltransferase-like isoleucine patch superfamily enzyme